jgi:Spy/CpxP family protein refolding chaperone
MSDSRVRVWFSLFVLAVFCVGVAAGALLGRRMGDAPSFGLFGRGPRALRSAGPEAPGEGRRGGPRPGVLVERLTRELDLTPEQRLQLERVLTERRSRIEAFQRDVRSRFESEQLGLRDEIRNLLTPAQQERFDRSAKDGRGRFGRRGPPR